MTDKNRELTEHELLSEILEKNAKAEKHRKTVMITILIVAVCIVIALVLIIPRILTLIEEAEIVLSNANKLMKQIQPAADSFNQIDFEGLNSSIATLQESITKFSDVMSIFGR